MNHPWSVAGTRVVAQDWLMGGLVDRRHFLAVSGAALAGAVSAYLAAELPAAAAVPPGQGGGDLLVEQIEASIPLLQQLDDAKGGAASLGYVGAQLRAVALVLHEGTYTAAATRRLLSALADLGQLAGWMAFDANQHGLAQRYFFTGLRAAHDAGYTADGRAHPGATCRSRPPAAGIGPTGSRSARPPAAMRYGHQPEYGLRSIPAWHMRTQLADSSASSSAPTLAQPILSPDATRPQTRHGCIT